MNTHVPGPPLLNSSPILKLSSPLRTITSSLSPRRRHGEGGAAFRCSRGLSPQTPLQFPPSAGSAVLSVPVLPGAMFHIGSCPDSATKFLLSIAFPPAKVHLL